MNKFQKKINVEIEKLLKTLRNSNLSTIKNFDKLCQLSINAIKKNKTISSFEDGRRALIIANTASNSLKQKKQLKIKF